MKTLILAFTIFVGLSASAEEKAFLESSGALIKGFDPVSYVEANKATKGNKKNKSKYKELEVYFASKENKALFDAEPEKYIPAYHGFCAWAMAKSGDNVDSDPKSFKVIEGKTYLFYDGIFADTRKKWNDAKDDPGLVSAANQNWAKK